MTAPAPIDVLRLRAECRALLWAVGSITLHEAVDILWRAAFRSGLVDELGADEIQKVFADAFAPHRQAIDEFDADEFAPCCDCGLPSCINPPFCALIERLAATTKPPEKCERPTPESTFDAIMYCVSERGLAALQEPANIERLSRCDERAWQQINERIERLLKKETAA